MKRNITIQLTLNRQMVECTLAHYLNRHGVPLSRLNRRLAESVLLRAARQFGCREDDPPQISAGESRWVLDATELLMA